MDPLTLGLIGVGVGYLALRKKTDAPDIPPATPDTSGELGIGKNRLAIHSLATSDGAFSLGGKAPVKTPQKPADVGQILGGIMGTLVPVLGVVAAVGGGSLTAGASIIASAVGAGAAIAVAIVAIVGFIISISFSVFSEADGLSKGRAQYMEDLHKLATAVHDAILPHVTGMSDANAEKWANCFAFVVCRGFNRSQIAYCLNNSDIVNNSFANAGNTSNRYIIDHWADRSRCIPEINYITKEDAGHQAALAMTGMGNLTNATIEAQLFGSATYEQTKAGLVALGLWHLTSSPGNEEDSADFLGRALSCTNIAVKRWTPNSNVFAIVFSPSENAKKFASYGMIGTRLQGMPNDLEFFSNRAQLERLANSAGAMIAVDVQNGTVADLAGKSGLKWFYDETAQTNQTVVR